LLWAVLNRRFVPQSLERLDTSVVPYPSGLSPSLLAASLENTQHLLWRLAFHENVGGAFQSSLSIFLRHAGSLNVQSIASSATFFWV